MEVNVILTPNHVIVNIKAKINMYLYFFERVLIYCT